MPKYELMYLVGSHVADGEIPKVSAEVKKFIEDGGGAIEKFEELGKRKLAYSIKKTNTGHYTLVNFTLPAEKVRDIEHKIRTNQNIIRHLIINLDEALVRLEKDRILQAKLKIRPREEVKPAPVRRKEGKKIEIDLDAEIERAIESPEDLK